LTFFVIFVTFVMNWLLNGVWYLIGCCVFTIAFHVFLKLTDKTIVELTANIVIFSSKKIKKWTEKKDDDKKDDNVQERNKEKELEIEQDVEKELEQGQEVYQGQDDLEVVNKPKKKKRNLGKKVVGLAKDVIKGRHSRDEFVRQMEVLRDLNAEILSEKGINQAKRTAQKQQEHGFSKSGPWR